MKLISLISRGPRQDRAGFQQWFLRDHAPAVLKQAAQLQHYIVNVNDVTPNMGVAPLDSAPVPRRRDRNVDRTTGASQTAAELYQATAGSAAVEEHLRTQSASCHAYLIDEVVQKDQQQFTVGGRAPGVNLVSAITFGEGKSVEQGARDGAITAR